MGGSWSGWVDVGRVVAGIHWVKSPFFPRKKIVGGVDNTDNYYQEGRSVILVMFNMLTCDVGETGTLNGVRKDGGMGE